MEWYNRPLESGLSVTMLPEVVYRRRIHYTNLKVGNPDAMLVRLRSLK